MFTIRSLSCRGLLACVLLSSSFLISTNVGAQTLKTALFVNNRAGADFDEKIPVVEDFLGAKISNLGIGVMTRDLLVGNLNQYDSATASALGGDGGLEAMLSDTASAKRFAEMIGADYIMLASITGFSERQKEVDAYGVQYTNYNYTLRMTYRLVDANGVALLGDSVKATQAEQNTIFSNEGLVGVTTQDIQFQESAPNAFSTLNPDNQGSADDGLAAAVQRYERAVGLVVSANGGDPVGMATAWAIAPNVFATNGHVSQPVAEMLARGQSAYVVLNKSPEQKYRIVDAVTHPQYMRVGPNFEGRDPVASTYDVGILKVDGSTDVWFPVAAREELMDLDSGYRIAFLGFPMEGLEGDGVDPRSPVATMQSGIITSNTDWWQGNADYEDRLLVQHNLGATGGASGSPIFNPRGEVVALLNAGNIVVTYQVNDAGETVVQRTPSAALINFGQRVDMLSDIHDFGANSRSTGFTASSSDASARSNMSRALFRDPDVSAFVDDLLDDATSQIAESLSVSMASSKIEAPAEAPESVEIQIQVETSDIYVPDVRLGPDNTVNILDGERKVSPLNVTVEVDGIAVGSAPGTIELKPGLSRLRLSRSGYEDWERMINAVDGQTIYVSMKMTESGLQRWKELTQFMNDLNDGAKLTDAQIELIRAEAQRLRQSGYRIDVEVDTEEAPTFEEDGLIKSLKELF